MFYSPAHNAVIYETDRPLQITAATQGAVRVNSAYVAVPATLDNLQALKKLDLLTPGPMDVDGYDWPIRAPWKPLPHQKTTANFMVLHKRAFCLNGMGTMKTLSILWAADYLMEMERRKGRRLRALINTPLSTTHVVWADTLFQNFMSRRTWVVLEGSAERRQKLLAKDVDFYIVNPDGLGIGVPSDPKGKITGLAADIAARTDIQLAIIDECRAYADATTKRHRAARKTIAGLEYLWLLTGTPTPNGPLDAYGQAKLINGAFGESFKSYKNRVMMSVGPFKWLPRQGSADAARKMLTPAIRFAIEDCVDLPECTVQRREVGLSSDQSKAYKELKTEACLMVKDGRMIQAVHQAALRMKLIQIACISHGTLVLTAQGWKPIQDVHPEDRLWDGEEFVAHDGLVLKGCKGTVELDGVRMTPEHEVLTASGWWSAQEIINAKSRPEFNRAKVRLPNSVGTRRKHNWLGAVRDLALSLRLWPRGAAQEPVPSHEASREPKKLWLPPWERNAQDEQDAAILHLDAYEASLRFSIVQGLEELRRARHNCVPRMEQFVRGFLDGHAGWVQQQADPWADRQQRGVQQEQLPLGDREAAGEQQAPPERMVYDILNCGPRQRFVVRGEEGQTLLVHNCGVVYDSEHGSHELDASPRLSVLQEAINDCAEKIIVFAPLTNVLHVLYRELSKTAQCAIINGQVSSDERTKRFRAFQDSANPLRVLIADPATMAHGVTLTAATVVVWYAPTDKTELYIQANKRIDRPGQTKTTTIIQIAATDIEREIYTRLENNQSLQGVILKLAEGRI